MAEEGAFSSMITNVFVVLTNFISLLGITYILFQLPWYIVLLLVAVVIVNSFMRAKSQTADHDFMMKTRGINRKVNYTVGLLSDYVYGKEIRSYQLSSFITEKYMRLHEAFFKMRHSLAPSYIGASGASAATASIQRVAVFIALIRQYTASGLSFGDISSLLVATEQYTVSLSKMIEVVKTLQLQFVNLEVFRRIMDTPTGKNATSPQIPYPISSEASSSAM